MLAGILTCLLLFQDLSLAARKVELALRWSELQPHIGQRNVALVLPDGIHVAGKVTEITSDHLVLNVTKSSDPKGHPKGATCIARSAVSVIQLNETKGSRECCGQLSVPELGLSVDGFGRRGLPCQRRRPGPLGRT